jgi:uncharacterized SAM-binding protein YcdF (DUF218 family)
LVNMPILIDKILTVLVLPLGLTLTMLIAAAAFFSAGRRRLAGLIMVSSLVLLWVFSTPLMAQMLLLSLENQYPPSHNNATADVAILLGGILEAPEKPGGEPGVSGAADRALHAARLFRAGRVRYILISAGNLPWHQARVPEAEQIAFLLREWGVPSEALIIEGQSRNTYENAARSKPIWAAYGFHSGLLVTSAFHMPRAFAVFRRAGFNVEPEAADFHVGPRFEGGVFAVLPDAAALALSSTAIREWLGLLVYRVRGWA